MAKILMTEVFKIKEAIPDSSHTPRGAGYFQSRQKLKDPAAGMARDVEDSGQFSTSSADAEELLSDPNEQYKDLQDLRGKSPDEMGNVFGDLSNAHENDLKSQYTTRLADGNFLIITDEDTYGQTGYIIDPAQFKELQSRPAVGRGLETFRDQY
jgi:hypothetical protein